MKFWQLVASFKNEDLIFVLSKPQWKKFKTNFENYKEIVSQQNRDILDSEIPFDLVKEVCEKSELKFYLYYDNRRYILRSYKLGTGKVLEQITPFEVFLRFGGELIEETLEKGSSIVKPK